MHFRGPHDSIIQFNEKPAAKKPKLENVDKEFEEFSHDHTDYYTKSSPQATDAVISKKEKSKDKPKAKDKEVDKGRDKIMITKLPILSKWILLLLIDLKFNKNLIVISTCL